MCGAYGEVAEFYTSVKTSFRALVGHIFLFLKGVKLTP